MEQLKTNKMTNIELINYIATNEKFTNIVINGLKDKTPMQAIEYLSCELSNNFEINNNNWDINDYRIPNTLLCYKK